MNIQDLGSIGEFISAIAVLVTLLYLAIQVRAMRASSTIDVISQSIHESAQLYALDIEHANLLIKANEEAELTNEELFVLDRIYRTHMSYYFHQFYQTRETDSKLVWIPVTGCCRVLESNRGFMNLFLKYSSEFMSDPDENIKEFLSLVRAELESREDA